MLEFDTNTLAFMTAALEQSSKKLRKDSPEARKFIAQRLTACARAGGKSMAVFCEAGEMAVDELDFQLRRAVVEAGVKIGGRRQCLTGSRLNAPSAAPRLASERRAFVTDFRSSVPVA